MYDLVIESDQLPSLNRYIVGKPHRLFNFDTDLNAWVASIASMSRFITVLQNSELADPATVALAEERAKQATPESLKKSVIKMKVVPAYKSKSKFIRAIR